jgi:hypothetical protein
MKTTKIIAASLSCLIVHQALAGDAVALAFNSDGIWTAVTYSRSSTPKGGPHYREATQACTEAERDLHARASEGLARVKIIGQSDRTGYISVARGRKLSVGHQVTAVGRGKSQAEADQNVLEKLKEAQAMDGQFVYRYFSYGSDSTAHQHSSTKASSSSPRNESVRSADRTGT